MQATLRSRWVRRANRAAIVVAVLVGAYAAAGFVAVPRILRSQLTTYVSHHYHRALGLGAIHFNPFTLRLEVDQLSFPGLDAKPMLGARRIQVTLALASLWRLAPSFKTIVLDRPFAHVVVRRNGRFNLADLARKGSRRAPPVRNANPLELFINQLLVIDGRLRYEDRSHPTPFRTELSPIHFALENFRTVGAAPDRYTLEFATSRGARFHSTGTLAVGPFASHGQFRLTHFPLRTLWRYLRDRLHFEVGSGDLALGGRYTFEPESRSPLEQVNLQALTVSRLGLRPLADPGDVVDLAALHAQGAHVDVAHHSLSVDSVRLDGGTLHVSLDPDGKINLSRLAASLPTMRSSPAHGRRSAPWTIALPKVSVHGLKIIARDREVTPAATVTLQDLAMRVQGFRHPGRGPLAFSVQASVDRTGKLAVHGSYTLGNGAAHARVALDHFSLLPLQPFLAEKSAFALRSGQLKTMLDVRRAAGGGLSVKGNLEVRTLRVVDDLLGRDFVKWRRLALEGLSYRSKPNALVIRRILTVAPYARVIVTPQRKINIIEDFTAAHSQPTRSPQPQPSSSAHKGRHIGSAANGAGTSRPSAHSMSISIRRVDIKNGSAHYTDLWIVPHFFLAIQQLDGDIVGLSSNPSSRATVDLKGKVDRYAPISVSGTLNLFSATRYTNMRLNFHGVQLTTATPYSARFAGYKIKKGTMSADISYHLDRGELSADPHFVIDQLELGEKVSSPHAIHLPLKFAIALLKDRHGVINLNLPISGSLSDPEFRLGPLIVKVVMNLLTKAVTSPFTWLGRLVGGGEHLRDIDFKPGSAVLDPDSRRHLAKLAQALEKRPALKLNVPSDYSPTLDRRALAQAALQRSLDELNRAKSPSGAQGGTSAPPDLMRPPTRFRRLLELYRAQLGAKASLPPSVPAVLKASRHHHKSTTPLGPAITALQSALLARIHVPDHALRRLARRRAAAIQGALLQGTHIDPGRLFVLNTTAVKAQHGAVRVELALE